jgi:hypothetical protein
MNDAPRSKFPLWETVLILVIVGILLGLLFPVVRPWPSHPPSILRARIEIAVLVQAIEQFEIAYNRLPIPDNLAQNSPNDFTFGTFGTRTRVAIINADGPQANNAELVAILCDQTNFGDGKETSNRDHRLNPQRIAFLVVNHCSDAKSPGVGTDGVYRDPWGNPYIITLDLIHDGRCRDAFHCRASVSSQAGGTNGFYGLSRLNPADREDAFEFSGPVMVWSLGPDGKADPSKRADEPPNRDNVLSWRD